MADNEFTVPQTKHVGGNTVTIQKVFADSNNVVLEYTIDGSTGVLAPAEGGNVTLTLPGGQALYGAGGIAPRSESRVDGKLLFSPPIFGRLRFPLASPHIPGEAFPGSPTQVDVQFAVPAAGEATARFAVTVPFYAAKTVTIHQSATSHGHVVQLDRAVIAPSAIRFFYSTGHTFLPLRRWSLTVGANTYTGGGGYGGGHLTGGESYVDLNELVDLDELVVAPTGTWIVQASMPPAAGEGTWRFTFVVR